MTALIGTDAQFHCAGTGSFLNWLVDGVLYDDRDQRFRDRGIVKKTDSGMQSTLTVSATLENNGTSVQCVIASFTSVLVLSDNATLTVLPGMS